MKTDFVSVCVLSRVLKDEIAGIKNTTNKWPPYSMAYDNFIYQPHDLIYQQEFLKSQQISTTLRINVLKL